MDPISVIALSLGAGWASGLNLYAAVLTLGVLQDLGWVALSPHLQVLGSPIVLSAAAFMYGLEFFADKIPVVSTAWNALHTFIRIPAGAVLAAASVAGVDPEWALAAALIGGSVAAGTHFAKAGSRFALAMLPLPFAAVAASLGEDLAAVAILWVALTHPVVLLVLLALFMALLIWLLPRLFRLAKRMFQTIARWIGGANSSAAE
ncbi:MAG TPA: DUF4126 domain-containing protein [Alphaproteobacteria bacterium]